MARTKKKVSPLRENANRGIGMTPDKAEALFWALVFWVALMGHLGFMGWLADWLERNVKWGKDERRKYGRYS